MSDMDVSTIKKLKVAELRAELNRRGLETKGTKPILVERLIEAVNSAASEKSHEEEEQNDIVEVPENEEDTPKDDSQGDESSAVEEVEPMSTEVKDESNSEAPPIVPADAVEESEGTEGTDSTKMETDAEQVKGSEETTSAIDEVSQGNHVDAPQVVETTAVEEMPQEENKSPAKENAAGPRKSRWDHEETKVDPTPEVVEEPEVELDDNLVVLDKYNSDLHLVVSPDGISAQPLSGEGFQYLWAGARGTWGVKTGKVFFECKVASLIKADIPDTEDPKQAIRIGWSLDTHDLQLGEAKQSYGYESTGKSCHESEFTEYGQAYGEGDVIGCYLDLESDPHTIAFSKNGEDLGKAFEFSAEDTADTTWFPHLLVKNAQCVVNFGSQEAPWFPPNEGFTFMQQVAAEERIHGTRGPKTKGECEVLMMIGLPASGKTTWVNTLVDEHPEKKYNVIGTNTIMEKMKINGMARKKGDDDYEKLMDKTTKCLNKLFDLAAKKKRNFILDQTNCYQNAQKRKMRPFKGYKKKAIIVIPTKEVLQSRMEEKKEKEGIDIPSKVIDEMKGNFCIPRVDENFDELVYVEEDAEKGLEIVKSYHKEGHSGGRGDFRHRNDHRSPPYRSHDRRDDRRDARRGGPSWGSPPSGFRGGGSGFRGNRPQRGYDSRQFRPRPYQSRGGSGGGRPHDNRQRDNRPAQRNQGGWGGNKPNRGQSFNRPQQQFQQQQQERQRQPQQQTTQSWNQTQQPQQQQQQQTQWNQQQANQYAGYGNYNWGNYQQQYSQQYPQQQATTGNQQAFYGQQQYGQAYQQQQYPQYTYSQYGQYGQQQ